MSGETTRSAPKTGTFSQTGLMSEPRRYFTAAGLPDGRVLIAGGGGTGQRAELFDPITMKFTPTAPRPS